jgi:hypothetical protein
MSDSMKHVNTKKVVRTVSKDASGQSSRGGNNPRPEHTVLYQASIPRALGDGNDVSGSDAVQLKLQRSDPTRHPLHLYIFRRTRARTLSPLCFFPQIPRPASPPCSLRRACARPIRRRADRLADEGTGSGRGFGDGLEYLIDLGVRRYGRRP